MIPSWELLEKFFLKYIISTAMIKAMADPFRMPMSHFYKNKTKVDHWFWWFEISKIEELQCYMNSFQTMPAEQIDCNKNSRLLLGKPLLTVDHI